MEQFSQFFSVFSVISVVSFSAHKCETAAMMCVTAAVWVNSSNILRDVGSFRNFTILVPRKNAVTRIAELLGSFRLRFLLLGSGQDLRNV